MSRASQQGRAWLGSEPGWALQSQAPILQAPVLPPRQPPKAVSVTGGWPQGTQLPSAHTVASRHHPRPGTTPDHHPAGRPGLARKRGDTGLPQRAAGLKPCSAQGEVAPKQLLAVPACPLPTGQFTRTSQGHSQQTQWPGPASPVEERPEQCPETLPATTPTPAVPLGPQLGAEPKVRDSGGH